MAWPPTTHQDVQDEVAALRDGRMFAMLGPHGPMVAGRYYSSALFGANGATGVTHAANRLSLVPLFPKTTFTIDRLGIFVQTAAAAGGKARLGIYTADATTYLPNTVLLDAGEVATDVAIGVELIVSQALTESTLYYAAILTSASVVIEAQVREQTPQIFGSPLDSGFRSTHFGKGSVAYGALPSPAGITISANVSSALAPIIKMRVA